MFEAVSALEVCPSFARPLIEIADTSPQIMDSKMDSGYLEEGESPEDEYNVLRQLLPEEVIGIMDQMLCLEVCNVRIDKLGAVVTFPSTGRVAHGISPLPDAVHLHLHQSLVMA